MSRDHVWLEFHLVSSHLPNTGQNSFLSEFQKLSILLVKAQKLHRESASVHNLPSLIGSSIKQHHDKISNKLRVSRVLNKLLAKDLLHTLPLGSGSFETIPKGFGKPVTLVFFYVHVATETNQDDKDYDDDDKSYLEKI